MVCVCVCVRVCGVVRVCACISGCVCGVFVRAQLSVPCLIAEGLAEEG